MQNQPKIRVMIVDDHPMVRKGLSILLGLREGIEVVGEAWNGREAILLCQGMCPDVILMDLMLPEMDGIAATRAIHLRWPQVRIIALTHSEDTGHVQAALQAGAISYLLKNISGDELGQAIERTYQGRPTLAPEAVRALVHTPPLAALEPKAFCENKLSRRELEVLTLLVKGLNNPAIADRLFVSRATVKVHIRNILSKLGVSNRCEAVRLALQRRLVHPE